MTLDILLSVDAAKNALTAVTAAGIGAAAGCLVWVVLKKITRAKSRKALEIAISKERGSPGQTSLPPQVRHWLKAVEEKIESSGTRLNLHWYLVFLVLGVLGGLVFGIGVLHNVPAAVFLAVGGYLLPERILISREEARQQRMVEQLGGAARIFAGEFAETPQLRKALSETARRMPEPLGQILRRADTELLAGKSVNEVTASIAASIKNEYGQMFAQLLREAENSASVRPLFSRLALRIASQQELIKKNRSQLAGVRILGLLLNALLVPAYLIVSYLVPEANEFLISHAMGKLIVCVCCASVVTGVILDKVLSRVAD